MYYRPETQEVFTTHSEIRNSFATNGPLVIFSDVITDVDLAHRGVFPLAVNPPAIEAAQIAVPSGAVEVDGVWTQEYTVRDKTQAELDADKPKVPFSVTRRQARQALLLKGFMDKVAPAIASIPDETHRGMAQIEWEDSQVFERNRPFLVQIGTALGLDSAGMDALFIFAATL